ncbi:acyltransferase [Eggerthia catenaformis]|uniref:acyltransferase n=1 Tax=Eggerthia catenaformis TaxID=31973 RepID=UPI003C6F328F
MEKKRYDGLDLMKAIAILMVISLHIPLWHINFIEHRSITRMFQYGGRLLSEGVPIFVTINGFLMLRKSSFDLDKHLKKCAKLFGIFLFWAVVYTIVGISVRNAWSSTGISDFFIYIFETGGKSTYTGGLWFLQWLFGVYLIFPILWYVYKNDFRLFQYFFIMLFIVNIGLNTLDLLGNIIYIYDDAPSYFEMIQMIKRFAFIREPYILFFCFGGMVYHYYDEIIKRKKLIIITGILAWLTAWGYGLFISFHDLKVYNQTFNYGTICTFLIMLGWFAITSDFKADSNVASKLLVYIGKNTFVFYIYHKLLVNVIKALRPELMINHRFIIYGITIIFCLMMTWIVNKVSVLSKLTAL